MDILIIGGGEIGKALEKILEDTNNKIEIWDKLPEKSSSKRHLDHLLKKAEIIFLCVPSRAVREVCGDIKEFVGPVICFSKGIDIDLNKRMDEVLESFFGERNNYAICYGPMLAEEIIDGGGSAGVLATKNKDISLIVKNVFSDTSLIIELTDDLVGVALGGILKNIYAIFIGSLEGLKWNSNLKSFFAGKALKEMRDIIKIMGGKEESIWLSSGLADFIATANSPYSSNRSFGEEIILKGDSKIEPEGFFSYSYITSSLEDKIDDYPLLKLISKVVDKDEEVKKSFLELLR